MPVSLLWGCVGSGTCHAWASWTAAGQQPHTEGQTGQVTCACKPSVSPSPGPTKATLPCGSDGEVRPDAGAGRHLGEVTDWPRWTEPKLPEGLVNTHPAPSLPQEGLRHFKGLPGTEQRAGVAGQPAGPMAVCAVSPLESSCRHYLICQTLASRPPAWGEWDSLPAPRTLPVCGPGRPPTPGRAGGRPETHEGK